MAKQITDFNFCQHDDARRAINALADGHVRLETFAVDTKDGAPDPLGEGVFIGEDNFYPDSST
jgi:VCBS repeat-containing protein